MKFFVFVLCLGFFVSFSTSLPAKEVSVEPWGITTSYNGPEAKAVFDSLKAAGFADTSGSFIYLNSSMEKTMNFDNTSPCYRKQTYSVSLLKSVADQPTVIKEESCAGGKAQAIVRALEGIGAAKLLYFCNRHDANCSLTINSLQVYFDDKKTDDDKYWAIANFKGYAI